jgi:ADP-ribosylglycohydrolase
MGSRTQLASGCLFGSAFGDSLGEPVEFMHSVADIRATWGPQGPEAPIGDPATVTDDTQMALAVGEALTEVEEAGLPYTAAALEPALRRAFVAWSISPENNRAPGMTCLQACRGLREGKVW